MNLEIRPPKTEGDFQRGLDRCFPSWGGKVASRWFFERRIDAPPADLLALTEKGEAVAGLAVPYRRLRLASGGEVRTAFLTGGWTAPEVRRRGALNRLLEEGLTTAAARFAALALAFVTVDNTSFRQVRRLGFTHLPTAYLVGFDGGPASDGRWEEVDPDSDVAREFLATQSEMPPGVTGIVYPNLDAWGSQFLGRPDPSSLLRLGSGGWAVVEEAGGTDRVQFLEATDRPAAMAVLAHRARSRGRSFFAFDGPSPAPADWLERGFEVKVGAMVAKVIDPARLGRALGLDDGTRESESSLLSALQPWAIQGGDRM